MKFTLTMIFVVLAQFTFADENGSGKKTADENKAQANGNLAPLNEKVLRTNKALKSYNEEYLVAPDNKAFAQSPEGHWNFRSDRVTVEMAKEDALAGCNKHVRPKESACVIVNVNGEWVQPPQ
ncbi:MAG: hypothetical protein EOO52_03010 [Gammaproteobacteria bacterium]|nr:MAG: hypothetical protein EOO52_03010 [Gammaproteobacteria bacterium]